MTVGFLPSWRPISDHHLVRRVSSQRMCVDFPGMSLREAHRQVQNARVRCVPFLCLRDHPFVTDDMAFADWLAALSVLTASEHEARLWRELRYSFAYRLGDALAGATEEQPAMEGPAVYGVWLPWGLLYVGQTTNSARRLRDLPVGESHHLGNTFPPETWDRVVAVAWSQLPTAADAIARLDAKTVGLALEYQIQVRTRPLANAARRTPTGGWRPIEHEQSRSVGAVNAAAVQELFDDVWKLWRSGEVADDSVNEMVRVVRPRQLLAQDVPLDS
ncbi:hypothetical protein ACIGB8_14735 [Promicromonospora sukumoe]|uniref:hypothetical protein n=1 Tax=Promicromonospora sukumoe TaxID=88382 RepID=UPI0037C50F57